MVFHRCFIAVHSSWLDRHQIVLCPDVQPFSYRQLAGGFVGAIVQRRRDLAQLLRHFLLRLSSDAALDMLARAGVEALCVAALPVGVGFSVPCCCDLPDRTGAAGSFSCFCTRHIRSFPPRGMYHLHDISRTAIVQVLFPRRKGLLPQELQQSLSRNTNLPTDTDASYLTAADQLIGSVASDAEEGHQVLHPQDHGEVV